MSERATGHIRVRYWCGHEVEHLNGDPMSGSCPMCRDGVPVPTSEAYDPGRESDEGVDRLVKAARTSMALHRSMALSGEAETDKSREVFERGLDSLARLERLARSAWPRQVHESYLEVLTERDELQRRLDDLQWRSIFVHFGAILACLGIIALALWAVS